jgi:hypothetical protein
MLELTYHRDFGFSVKFDEVPERELKLQVVASTTAGLIASVTQGNDLVCPVEQW